MTATGFVVVCDEDGILFGQGDTLKAAWDDANVWIDDALRSQLRDEIHFAQANAQVRVCVDLTWKAYPATEALRQSIGVRGGHDDWHERADGVLAVGRKAFSNGGDRLTLTGTGFKSEPFSDEVGSCNGAFCKKGAGCSDALCLATMPHKSSSTEGGGR